MYKRTGASNVAPGMVHLCVPLAISLPLVTPVFNAFFNAAALLTLKGRENKEREERRDC